MAEQHTTAWRTILLACRHAGIVVVTSAGANGAFVVTDEGGPDDCFWETSAGDGLLRFPETLAGEFPELIVVGAAGIDGTYRIQNSRILDDHQDWVFAHGYPIEGMAIDGSVRDLQSDMWAAPLVVCLPFLSLPVFGIYFIYYFLWMRLRANCSSRLLLNIGRLGCVLLGPPSLGAIDLLS